MSSFSTICFKPASSCSPRSAARSPVCGPAAARAPTLQGPTGARSGSARNRSDAGSSSPGLSTSDASSCPKSVPRRRICGERPKQEPKSSRRRPSSSAPHVVRTWGNDARAAFPALNAKTQSVSDSFDSAHSPARRMSALMPSRWKISTNAVANGPFGLWPVHKAGGSPFASVR